MEEIFKNIDVEKRDRIINSALEEFSKNKFDKASTNNIVKNANISKGLLYHYFKSKKDLYEFLEIFVIRTIVKEIEEKIDWNETDFFLRVQQVVIIKMGVMKRYPHMYDFASMIYENRSFEELMNICEEFSPELYHKIYYENIDYTKFKDDLDIKRVLSIIRWTYEKYGEELCKAHNKGLREFDMDNIKEDFTQYSEILKNAFYK